MIKVYLKRFFKSNKIFKKYKQTLSTKQKTLPIYYGSEYLRPIKYIENRGSAQCKSCVMLAALNIHGETSITAKKSRSH